MKSLWDDLWMPFLKLTKEHLKFSVEYISWGSSKKALEDDISFPFNSQIKWKFTIMKTISQK